MGNSFENLGAPESVDIDVSEFEIKPTQKELETKEKVAEIREAIRELKDRQTTPYATEKYRHLRTVLEKYDQTGELDDVGMI
jgi:hypothetical protein